MKDRDISYAGFVPRALAYMLDCTIAFAFLAVTQLLLFVPIREVLGISEDWFYSGWNTELYMLLTISLPIWLYFILLEKSTMRATWGKKALKLQVVNTDGGSLSSFSAFLRTLIKLLPWEVAHIANNFPVPMWYTEQPGFRIGFAIAGGLMGGYMLTLLLTKRKQTVHDLVINSFVVKFEKP